MLHMACYSCPFTAGFKEQKRLRHYIGRAGKIQLYNILAILMSHLQLGTFGYEIIMSYSLIVKLDGVYGPMKKQASAMTDQRPKILAYCSRTGAKVY